MFPTQGLITPPVVSELEVAERETERKVEVFLGGPSMGSETKPVLYAGARTQAWSAIYERRVLYLSTNNVKTKYLDIGSISEFSICFDQYMLPTIVYRQRKEWFMRRYDPFSKEFVTTALDYGDIITPRLCYDDKRVMARKDAEGLLFYYIGANLYVRGSSNDYLTAKLLRTEETDENYISQVCMGDNGRLHIVTYILVDEDE